MEKKLAFLAAGCCCLLLVAASLIAGGAAAQDPNNQGGYTTVTIVGNEKTASNEMGYTKMLNQVELNETCANLEALVHFNTYLDDGNHHGTYYMFQVIWNQNPIQVSDITLTTLGGQTVKVFEQGPEGAVAHKMTVLKRDMPPLGTDMKLAFKVCSEKRGLWEVGTIVMVFDETWTKVTMSGGIPAEIYNSAKLLVMNGQGPERSETGIRQFLPLPAVPAVLGLLGLTAWAARRKLR